MADMVNHPDHYCGKIEVIDVIDAYDLNFELGNVVKYVLRAGNKVDSDKSVEEKAIEDLQKACWYLRREIERRMSREVDKHCTPFESR